MLRDAREVRKEMAIEAAGNYWSEETRRRRIPVNLLSLYQTIISRSLVAKTPRYMMTTPHDKYAATVSAENALLNRDIERMKAADTFQRIVIDALYSVGIAKISLATPCDSANLAWRQQAGKVVLSRVDLDDFVCSMNSHDWSELDFIGHRYRCPLDVAQDLYKKQAKELRATSQDDNNREGDERIGKLGRGSYGDLEFEEHVDLWEIYLPRHRKVITLSDQDVATSTADGHKDCLWEQDWIGPESGPYEILGFGIVPGNLLPKAPMMDLMDLHLDANDAFRKANRMIRRLKELTTFRKGNDDDAEAIMKAVDGALIGLDDPKSVGNIVTGGQAVQVVLAIAEAYKTLFSFMGGNLELLGGRSPQSRTAKQDSILNENAAVGIADMQERTIRFISEVGERIAWFNHEDPVSIQKVPYQVNGDKDLALTREIHPYNSTQPGVLKRDFKFEDMDCKLDPYSIRYQTPQQKLEAMNNAMMNVITPLMPILQSQGWTPDMEQYLQNYSNWSDLPELRRLMNIGEKPTQDEAGPTSNHERTLAPKTERTYTRRSESGPTQGSDQQMQAAMLGIDLGGSQNGKAPAGLIGA